MNVWFAVILSWWSVITCQRAACSIKSFNHKICSHWVSAMRDLPESKRIPYRPLICLWELFGGGKKEEGIENFHWLLIYRQLSKHQSSAVLLVTTGTIELGLTPSAHPLGYEWKCDDSIAASLGFLFTPGEAKLLLLFKWVKNCSMPQKKKVSWSF